MRKNMPQRSESIRHPRSVIANIPSNNGLRRPFPRNAPTRSTPPKAMFETVYSRAIQNGLCVRSVRQPETSTKQPTMSEKSGSRLVWRSEIRIERRVVHTKTATALRKLTKYVAMKKAVTGPNSVNSVNQTIREDMNSESVPCGSKEGHSQTIRTY
jgi:hypothetical protein